MSEFEWSDDQLKIIQSRGSELLVSAAAGSGKTAVLVERIYQRIVDKAHPVDIDRFVVVTFTNAAAAQMKDKIRVRIEKELSNPDIDGKTRSRLRRQIGLLPMAHISTVHSFCSFIIGQYFHRIGVDPSLRLGDETQLLFIKKEVLAELIEKEYIEAREDFIRLADLRALSKNDTPLEDWILYIYEKVMSEPFTEVLLEDWENKLDAPFDDNSVFLREIINHEVYSISGLINNLNSVTEQFPDMPDKFAEGVVALRQLADNILNISEKINNKTISYTEAYEKIRQILTCTDIPIQKSKPTNEDLQPVWQKLRPMADSLIADRDIFFFQSIDEHEADRANQAQTSHAIIRLVRQFKEMYSAAKSDKGLMDFNDLEQFAIDILFDVDSNSGRRVRSDAAKELSELFEEVMIDEYQDSNRVQDTILWAVSKAIEEDKNPWESLSENRFMVGDVKQSIYRFRNACPEIFEEKLEIFSDETTAKHKRIDLHQNFRSRAEVLDSTNAVFDRVMHMDIGGVEYDKAARLVCGRKSLHEYEGVEAPDDVSVDIVLNNNSESIVRQEARHIAGRIRDMVEGESPVYIEKNKTLTRVRYADIVILTRAIKNISSEFLEVFEDEGVPLVSGLSQGFTEAREISLMIELLQVIDNPRQDVPLAGVVLSPLYDIDEDKLAIMRSNNPRSDLYDVILSSDDTEVNRFSDMLAGFRSVVSTISTADLIEKIYVETGIYDVFAALPDGSKRSANLDYLKELAIEFDSGSGGGTHAFVEYLSKIKENKQELEEASVLGEEDDVVKLMTIHKSKGLEFPVVFVARCFSDSYRADTERFVYDSEFGIATYAYDIENGIRKHNIFRDTIARINTTDEKGEALRLLYVAMTRAEDKLILVGTSKEEPEKNTDTDYFARDHMKSYMDMILPAVYSGAGKFNINIYDAKDVSEVEEVSEKSDSSTRIEKFYNFDTSTIYNSKVRELLRASGSDIDDDAPPIPAKVSVSELKKASLEDTEEGEIFVSALEDTEENIPRFMKTDDTDAGNGALYGTIVHQVMATIDFKKFVSDDATDGTNLSDIVSGEIDRLISIDRLRPDESKRIPIDGLIKFFTSDLGRDMIVAEIDGKLHREQAFTMSKPASEIYSDRDEDTPVLIQGIIDAYYETDDGIVLMDYKTDSLDDGQEQTLVDRYRVQMELYRDVLEKNINKKVIKIILYSFSLDKEIFIKNF